MKDEKITIIIPVYNRGRLIAETLLSVLNQTYKNWECIVVDDGSLDDTLAVVSEFVSGDARFKLLSRGERPKGASTCRNIGIEHATGSYLIFLDSDDLLDRFCLEGRLRCARKYPDKDFLVFSVLFFDQKPGDMQEKWLYLHHSNHKLSFLIHGIWQTSGPLWRRESLGRHRFTEGVLSYQDWEFHLRYLCQNEPDYVIIDEVCDVYIRRGEKDNITLSHRSQRFLENRVVLYEQLFPVIMESLGQFNLTRKILIGRYLTLLAFLNQNGTAYQKCITVLKDDLRVSPVLLILIKSYLGVRGMKMVQDRSSLAKFVRFVFRFVLGKYPIFYY